MVSHIAHHAAHGVPLKILGRLAVLAGYFLGAFRREVGLDPFPGEFGRQHQRPAVVNIYHAGVAGGGDDHETIVVA